MDAKELCKIANSARNYAYSPYSGYTVGAALLCKDGTIYTGCNIENASFGATNCAERTAFFKAISEGQHEFEAIAVSGAKKGQKPDSLFQPCGICRQVMREFCKDDFLILMCDKDNSFTQMTMAQLLPSSFSSDNLKG